MDVRRVVEPPLLRDHRLRQLAAAGRPVDPETVAELAPAVLAERGVRGA